MPSKGSGERKVVDLSATPAGGDALAAAVACRGSESGRGAEVGYWPEERMSAAVAVVVSSFSAARISFNRWTEAAGI